MSNVDQFETDFLIALAKEQKKNPDEFIDCFELVEVNNIPHEKHWIEATAKKFKANGWGYIEWDVEEVGFNLNATGIAAGDRAAHIQAPVSFFTKLKNVPRSDWISILALLVSAIALFKGD